MRVRLLSHAMRVCETHHLLHQRAAKILLSTSYIYIGLGIYIESTSSTLQDHVHRVSL